MFLRDWGDDAGLVGLPCAPAEAPDLPLELVHGDAGRVDQPHQDGVLHKQIEDVQLLEGVSKEARLRQEAFSVRHHLTHELLCACW